MGTPKQLGKGAFGCAYKPPVCTSVFDTGDPNYLVGKIATPEGVKKEIAVSKILTPCQACSDYFGILTGNSCDPTITSELKKECHIIDAEPKLVKSYSSKYGGIPLNKYLEANKVSMDWLYDQYAHLLEGLVILKGYKILHRDIKSDNILVDEKGVCRIIDFGMSMINPDGDALELELELGSLGFYQIWPIWYNAYIDTSNHGTYYYAYEHIAKFFDKNYVKGTATDPIRGILDDNEPNYVDRVVVPNVYKVDVYSLTDVFNDAYLALKKTNPASGPKRQCLEETILKIFVLDANTQYDATQALQYMRECYKRKTATAPSKISPPQRVAALTQIKSLKINGLVLVDSKWTSDDTLVLKFDSSS